MISGFSRVAAAAVLVTMPAGLMVAQAAPATTAAPLPVADASHSGTFLLTIFLKHDESKPLAEINAELKKNGFYRDFPPEGTEIVSWYVVMGIGQIVTLRVPAEKLRAVNLVIENSAWGGYRTEFYPTYDYRQPWEALKKQMNAK